MALSVLEHPFRGRLLQPVYSLHFDLLLPCFDSSRILGMRTRKTQQHELLCHFHVFLTKKIMSMKNYLDLMARNTFSSHWREQKKGDLQLTCSKSAASILLQPPVQLTYHTPLSTACFDIKLFLNVRYLKKRKPAQQCKAFCIFSSPHPLHCSMKPNMEYSQAFENT